jgi:hypothetical protein
LYTKAKEEIKLNKPGNEDDHYRAASGFEAIDVIESWNLNFNLGNAIKYICRAGIKNESKSLEDLKKASWYLNREISRLSKN